MLPRRLPTVFCPSYTPASALEGKSAESLLARSPSASQKPKEQETKRSFHRLVAKVARQPKALGNTRLRSTQIATMTLAVVTLWREVLLESNLAEAFVPEQTSSQGRDSRAPLECL